LINAPVTAGAFFNPQGLEVSQLDLQAGDQGIHHRPGIQMGGELTSFKGS
jgi:hypothetical protein